MLLAAMATACSTSLSTAQTVQPGAAGTTDLSAAVDGSSASPGKPLSISEQSDLVYKILSAEIAGRRGRVDIAARNYFDAASNSGDARVAERAVKLAMFGRDWGQAGRAVDRWVELSPTNVDAWQHKVQISLQVKDVDSAAGALEQIVAISGREPTEVIPGLVSSLLRQTDAELGAEVLTRLGARFPDSADTQYGIGRFAMSRGDRETALAAFEKALAIEPDNIEALLSLARIRLDMGAGETALDPIAEFVERNPGRAPALLGYARLLVETGKYERASEQLELISARFDDDSEALFSIGLLALEIKRVEQAERYFQQLVTLDQYVDEGHYYLARISDSRKEYQQAINRYEQVQGGDNFLDAQIRSAELYALIGELDRGRERIANLRSLSDERSVQLELISAESRMLVGNDRQAEAMSVLSEGLDNYPDDPDLLYSRALVAEQLDQQDIFEGDLKKVIADDPDNSYALNALGYFLVDRNMRLDEAEEYLEAAISINPDDPAIIDSVGWLYFRQGRYEESIETLRRAYKILPDSEIAAHLGEVLWVSGDQNSATRVWEEALKVSPDDDLLNKVMKKFIR